jgi:hypothetical protein
MASRVGAETGANQTYFPSLFLNGGWSGYTQQFSNVNDQISGAQSDAIAGAQQCARQRHPAT